MRTSAGRAIDRMPGGVCSFDAERKEFNAESETHLMIEPLEPSVFLECSREAVDRRHAHVQGGRDVFHLGAV